MPAFSSEAIISSAYHGGCRREVVLGGGRYEADTTLEARGTREFGKLVAARPPRGIEAPHRAARAAGLVAPRCARHRYFCLGANAAAVTFCHEMLMLLT